MNSFESYDAFISYKWDEHKSNVHFMADQLEKRNLRVWLDRNKIKESEDLSITMKNGIDQSELFICCVTENYCDFESPKNKNCKSEFNYAFSTNKKILYVIFADVKGLGEAEIIKKFNAVGFRMSGNLFYKYSQSNLDEIFHAIQLKKQKIIKIPLNHYLPNQTYEYVRKTKLEENITHLFEKTNVVIITGSSGMGKTFLAVNYGRELANNERKIVRFINSNNKDSIFDSLRKILCSLTSMQQKFGESELIEHLIFHLDRYKVEYFFIIDNLSEFYHIKSLIEKTNQNVDFLITTQIQDNEAFGKNTEKIDMSNFDYEETYEYLTKNLKRKDKTEKICSDRTKVILETSDNQKIMPIYLVQIVLYLNENKEINLRNFITNFKDVKFDIMSESLRKIREENKPLWSLLKFASILEGSFIHYKLLKLYLNINAEDQKTLGVLITSAQQYSLLKEDYDEENEYGIRIHELIQKGIQNKAKSLFKKIKKMANTLNTYYEDASTNPDNSWLNSIYSIKHAKKLLKNKDLGDKNIIISLNRKIALSHMNKEQEIEEGIRYCIFATEIEIDDKILSSLYLILGDGYKKIGKYIIAINFFEKSLDIQLKVSKSDYSSISKTYNSLGTVYHAMGEYNKAIKYHKNSLEIQLKTLKDDHPYIGDTYNNLGNVNYSLGENNKAIYYYNNSLKIRLKAFGNNHPLIADSYNNLGNVFKSKGEYKKAIKYNEMSLDIKLKKFKNDHPSIGVTYNNIGLVYYSMGEYKKAIEYYEKSIEIQLKEYKNDHPSIVDSYNNLANVHYSLGEYNKAIEYFNKSLGIFLKSFNHDHLYIGITYDYIGNVYDSMGEYIKAIECFKKSLDIKLKAYNHDNSSIGDTYNNLGNVYDSMGEYNKAIEYYEKSLEIKMKNLNMNHPTIGGIYSNLGNVYNSIGEYKKSIDYFEKSLEISLKTFNHDHPSLGDTYNNLGIVYKSMGEYNKAIEYYEKSLEIKLRAYNNDHPSIGDTYNNLGSVYNSMGEYNEAIEYFERSLEIKLRAYNHDHPSLCGTYKNIGMTYDSMGEHKKAIEFFNLSKKV